MIHIPVTAGLLINNERKQCTKIIRNVCNRSDRRPWIYIVVLLRNIQRRSKVFNTIYLWLIHQFLPKHITRHTFEEITLTFSIYRIKNKGRFSASGWTGYTGKLIQRKLNRNAFKIILRCIIDYNIFLLFRTTHNHPSFHNSYI